MKPFRILTLTLALSLGAQAVPAWAELSGQGGGSGDPTYQIQNPPAYAMIGDLLVARPFLIVATVVGAGLFVVSLPFTAAGGNIGAAGKALVVDPGKAAFVRCLGCTESGYANDR
ncbi:multidrug transporter [Pseudomonas typographi]|uniref:Multidrug transporter n=1 Tax=Pseudomonas typographi TaxID=2715964 RepID=A0ABR7YZE7_9PSED|nr:multidrug transporter [Pseudomonas typographi]MBD1549963.1 multidrug transporter [Pseudomonas typographi]MBD1585344.1 multidrug transporter [Pseudomonas typographi]MBD1598542.1 multidrug transporter [Pseudomonas typographi]